MDTQKKFSLYPCCVLTKGVNRALITDLQRMRYKLIPLALFNLLTKHKNQPIKKIINTYRDNKDTIINYYEQLIAGDWGILEKHDQTLFEPIQSHYYNPKLITNAIFDYCHKSTYSIPKAIDKLEELHCENLEIRFYDEVGIKFLLDNIFDSLEGTSIRNLELLVQFTNEFSLEQIIDIHIKYPRLRKIILSSSPHSKEKICNLDSVIVIYTAEKIKSEVCCGVIKPWYFSTETAMYIESINRNNCLNAKISVDKYGNIKNCPSMSTIFGHINTDSLTNIATNPEFKKIWTIKKDDIKDCRECEFRYICQDCRAYITDPNDLLSKPSKCNYNPYKQ